MAHDIPIKETIEDKKSWFNIKRFNISGTSFERPVKSLDLKEITQTTYDSVTKRHDFAISEITKVIRDYDTIKSLYNESDNYKINQFFQKKNWFGNVDTINVTFNFNPFKYVKKIDDMSGFYDQYYQYCKSIISVPNIRTTVKPPKKKMQTIIDADSYLKFVDESYDILNTKNHKPIFVPVSLRMSLQEISRIITHYLKKEYFYFWFDFEGKAINELSLSRLTHFFRIVKGSGTFDKTISYYTNIKREIISNAKNEKSPASDILASIAGANIIGVNREPPRMINGPPVPVQHKARIFDGKTYYYVRPQTTSTSKDENIARNSVKLDSEFESQTEYFLNENTIGTLLEKKTMLKEYKKGTILKQLTTKDSGTNLQDWF